MNDRLSRAWTMALQQGYTGAVRPVLFASYRGDPELIHERTIATLGALPAPLRSSLGWVSGSPNHRVRVAGIDFPGRIGVAAGLDKDGHAARAWGSLGFAFAELGTVTPRPQPGNERPRVFRLVGSRAVINRMGFNNHGATALANRLRRWGVRRGNNALGIRIGISIGRNKTTPHEDAIEDYLAAFDAVADVADYIAVNVSSPNTPGLRALQGADDLAALVTSLVARAAIQNPDGPLPVMVKVAPDLTDAALDEAVAVCEQSGAAAMIATNTTLARTGIASADAARAGEAGGLSGAPLTQRSREVVARIAARSSLPVIGVGGVMTPADGQALFDAGAQLIQLYTGFLYAGPALVRALNQLPVPDHSQTRETR